MQPIHLAIGLIEGVATGAVLSFVYGARKEIIQNALEKEKSTKASGKTILICFLVAALFFGGFISLYASKLPDGLEWSISELTGNSEGNNTSVIHDQAQNLQDQTAILPDYSFGAEAKDSQAGTSISGIAGAGITLLITVIAGFAIQTFKKRKKKNKPRSLEE
jgi:cobalt/nickel transport system permease protein